MKRVSVQKYPKGGPLGIKCKLFINISFYLRRSYGTIRMSIGDIRMLEREKTPDIPHFLWSLCQAEYPQAQINSKLYAVFGVFMVKYTYFKPKNILIEAKNILMISSTYEVKICRTTPVFATHPL